MNRSQLWWLRYHRRLTLTYSQRFRVPHEEKEKLDVKERNDKKDRTDAAAAAALVAVEETRRRGEQQLDLVGFKDFAHCISGLQFMVARWLTRTCAIRNIEIWRILHRIISCSCARQGRPRVL